MTIPHLFITIIVMLLFGSSYPIGKIGLNENLSPLIFSLLRILPMIVLLFPFLKISSVHRKNFRFVILYGLLIGLGLYPLMYLSLEFTSSTSSIILVMQLSIPIGVVLGAIYLQEKVSPKRWILISLVLIGLAIICFDPIVFESKISLFLGVLAAIAYGSASMLSKKIHNFGSLEVNSWMAVISFPLMFIMVSIFERNELSIIFEHSLITYAPALYSGIAISCIAQVLMLWLYKHYDVKTVLPFYSLFPVFGVILTIILLEESISIIIILGSLIVIGGNFYLQKIK